jgi:L-lactate dehydrogenase complex protein LldG
MSYDERISRLELEIQLLGGEVVRCTSKSLPRRISEVLVSEEITRLMTWDADLLPQDLLPALAKFGIECVSSPDPAIRAGLTGVTAAASETGSLLLPGGPGKPLLASLLPEIHLAVVQADQIAWSIDDLLQNPVLHTASAAALVSGPSRTGDIELTLTIGVHGPGRVVVFLVESPDLPAQSEN